MKPSHAVLYSMTLVVMGCGTATKTTTPDAAPETRESLYARGHAWYAEGRHDSATVYLERSRSVDPTYLPPLNDLAEIYYVAGAAGQESERRKNMRAALGCYAAIDSLGHADEATYDRLTELSHSLGDTDLFLFYSEKQVRHYPGDRQLYNLGLAYFGSGNSQKVIETQKGAIGKYPHSPYLAGFYRLLGDGYFNIDRQQTAERTYEEGLHAVDESVRRMKEANPGFTETAEYIQLAGNYRAMLASLKKIYRLHGKQDKLSELESRPDVGP